MSTIELKSKFHELIDNLEDEKLLEMYFDMITDETKEFGGLWMQLTEFQKLELTQLANDIDNSAQWVSNSEVFEKYNKWV